MATGAPPPAHNPYAAPPQQAMAPPQQGVAHAPYGNPQPQPHYGASHPPVQQYTVGKRVINGYIVSQTKKGDKTVTTYAEVLPDGSTRNTTVTTDKKGITTAQAAGAGACAACCLCCCCF